MSPAISGGQVFIRTDGSLVFCREEEHERAAWTMKYREIKPKAPLSHFVECFWTLESDAPTDPDGDPILPDGCPEMVLNLGEPFCEYKEDGSKQTQPKQLVVGQMTCPLRIGQRAKCG